MCVATVRDDDGALGALVPVLRRGRRLRFAGNDHTPWTGIFAGTPAAAEALAVALTSYAAVLRTGPVQTEGSSAAAVRVAARRAGSLQIDVPGRRSPYVVIEGLDNVDDVLDREFRKTLRRNRRRLAEQGQVELTVHTGLGGLDAHLAEAFAIEQRQWKGTAGTAIASNVDTLAFYRQVARAFAGRGELQLAFLRVAGRPVSFALDIVHGDVQYSLKTGYDPAFARFSPGQLITHSLLNEAVQRGVRRYELLGSDEPYKLKWTRAVHELAGITVFAPTASGTAHLLARKIAQPAARRVRRRLRMPAPLRARL
jgi:CelD/BcsL family acetyltransferase involved in cellulose biosynthesis